MVRIAINGFGRIGRQTFRMALKHPEVEIVALNDLSTTQVLGHLLKFDSLHGKIKAEVSYDDKNIIVDGKKIPLLHERDPSNLPWKDLGVDIVIESTGFFVTKELASKHIEAGAKRVIISAPSKDAEVTTIVMGVNEKRFDKEKDFVVSNASCTTNCLAPVAKILNDEFGINKGFMTTIHAVTGDQSILDVVHKDLRRARSAGANIIPTTTGAARAIGLVIPELQGKLDGLAIRVPVQVGSLTDLVAEVDKNVTKEEINEAIKEAANSKLKGILEYSEDPLVSSDIVGNMNSCIFDSLSTSVLQNNFVKVLAWYDNETGYSSRLIDLVKYISNK